LEILFFNSLSSTQKYLIEQIETEKLTAPVAVITAEQNDGIGSRDNEWSGGKGNFFASFAIPLSMLPDDLPLPSASIYFSFIMKKTLEAMGEALWLKWPNDLYVNEQKIGGTITKKIKDCLICGIGINLKKNENGYSALQSDISAEKLLKNYLTALEKFPKWKQVFSEYRVEFELSRKFSVHNGNDKISLENATLCRDGSLLLGDKKVYSLR